MTLTPEQIHKLREQWFYGTSAGYSGVAIIPQSAAKAIPEILEYDGPATIVIIPDRKLTPQFLAYMHTNFKIISEL